MHHALWWDEASPWWQTVHPMLVAAKVRAVFSGDLMPTKFAHLSRDNIDYVQTGIGGEASERSLARSSAHRAMAGQFDHFVEISAHRHLFKLRIVPFSVFESRAFTPTRWRAIYGEPNAPLLRTGAGWRRALVRSLHRLSPRSIVLLLALAIAIGFLVGWVVHSHLDSHLARRSSNPGAK